MAMDESNKPNEEEPQHDSASLSEPRIEESSEESASNSNAASESEEQLGTETMPEVEVHVPAADNTDPAQQADLTPPQVLIPQTPSDAVTQTDSPLKSKRLPRVKTRRRIKFAVNKIPYFDMISRSKHVFVSAFIASMSVYQWGHNVSATASAMDAISKCTLDPVNDGFFKPCIPMDTFQWSVAVSIMVLGGVFGALVLPKLSDYISRYWCFIWLNLFNILGCSLQIIFSEIWTFWLGRFLVGISAGGAFGTTGIFLAEIAPDSIRGLVSGIFGISAVFGLFFSSFLGIFLSYSSPGWRILIGVNAVVSILNLMLLPYCKRSPRWLIMKRKFDEARISLKFYRGSTSLDDPLILEEIKVVSESLREVGKVSLFKTLFSKKMIRPTLVNVVLSSGAQLVGTYMILSYSVFIFTQAGLSNGQVWSTLVSGSNWIGSILAALLFDRLGRRPQLIISHALFAFSMIVMSVSFALIDYHEFFAILCIVCMMVIVFAYGVGIGPTSIILVVEMHPIRVRGLAVSLGAFLNWSCFFIMGVLFPTYSEFMKGGTFVPFAVYNVLIFLFAIFAVRETKGRNIDLVALDAEEKVHEQEGSPLEEYSHLPNLPSVDSFSNIDKSIAQVPVTESDSATGNNMQLQTETDVKVIN